MAMTDRRPPREQPGPGRGPQSERPGSVDKPSAQAVPRSKPEPEIERERRVRRARFLAELDEARELRKRVAPRRARAAELQARVLRTFRY
jgi:hypothetical protein